MTRPPLLGKLLDGRGEDDDVIGGAVGSGVAGPEHPGEDFAGLGQHRSERVVPIGALG